MQNEPLYHLFNDSEIRVRAAQLRADYMRELFGRLAQRLRSAAAGPKARKKNAKLGDRVGDATA